MQEQCIVSRLLLLVGVLTVCMFTAASPVLAGICVPSPLSNASPSPFQPPKLLGKSDVLPGTKARDIKELRGRWRLTHVDPGTRLEEGAVPYLSYSLWIEILPDGHYESVYSAFWGARSTSSPDFNAVEVVESGSAVLRAGVLLLEPTVTRYAHKSHGTLNREELHSVPRSYSVTREDSQLNIAGRCAAYQIEPICKEKLPVLYPLIGKICALGGIAERPKPLR